VDAVGEVAGFAPEDGGGAWLTVRAPADVGRYLVEKGSICVDGVSLTVAGLDGDTFSVALIPHTLDVTTLGSARTGDPLNLEVDVIAKYVEALLEGRPA
jgi:riboflavin synthase